MKKKIITGVLIGLGIIGLTVGVYSFFFSNYGDITKIVEGKVEAAQIEDDSIASNGENTGDLPSGDEYLEEYDPVLDLMHTMTNSVVVAKEHWGLEDMNKENIDKAQAELEKLQDSNIKVKLLTFLEKWEKCDFKEVDEEHNYIWKLLGGTIGRATGINEEKVEEAIDNIQPGGK